MLLSKIQIWLYLHFLKQWYGYGAVSTKLLYAQAYHETGNFSSKIFKENNNIFGMRQAQVRKNYATGTAHAHATFSSLFNSVRDYFERQKYFKVANVGGSGYVESTVKSNYAEDREYSKKWLNIYNNVPVPVIVRYSNYIIGLVALVVAIYCFVAVFNLQNEQGQNKSFQKSVQKFQSNKV